MPIMAISRRHGHPYMYIQNTHLYIGQDRLEECVEILLRLQKSHPGHLLGRSQLGTCYMKKKEHKRARDMFTSVLKEDPNHGMALQNYGIPIHTYILATSEMRTPL